MQGYLIENWRFSAAQKTPTPKKKAQKTKPPNQKTRKIKTQRKNNINTNQELITQDFSSPVEKKVFLRSVCSPRLKT